MLKSFRVPSAAFVDVPTNNGYYFCPMCFDYCNIQKQSFEYNLPSQGRIKYIYCELCGIIFQPCCLIISRHHNDNTFAAKLIVEYTDNNILMVNRMPRFKSIEEAELILLKLNPVFFCHECSENNCVH